MRGRCRSLSRWIPGLLLLLAGCREELGPEQFETSRVSGILRVSGRSAGEVWKGWIEFIPVDGTVGLLRSAPIRPDGSFEVEGVSVGWNQIGLVNAPISRSQAGLFHPFSSPIRRKIPSRGIELEIDLYVEEIQAQKAALPRP